MTDLIKVVIVEPVKKPYIAMVKPHYSVFGDIVEGYARPLFIDHDNGLKFALMLNEDGLLMNLPLNRRIVGFENPIVGTFFVTAYDLEGDNVSLPDELSEKYIKLFTPLEVYL